MRIFLDNIIFRLQKAGGISVYWYELSRGLLRLGQRVSFIDDKRRTENLFGKKLRFEKEDTIRERAFPLLVRRYLPAGIGLPPQALFHSSYYRYCCQREVINVITLYDFVYEYFRNGVAKQVHSLQKRTAIKKADGIICISESTKRDLYRFFPSLVGKEVVVIYNGVSDEFFPVARESSETRGLDGKPILFVGDRKQSYKNFKLAVEVARYLGDVCLVLVGGGELTHGERALLKRELDGRYRHYPSADARLLNRLYNASLCLIYPSVYEGFGMPILEAMQVGCPVVTTKLSSIREVCGDAGIMVDEVNAKEFMLAIKKLEDKGFRRDCVEKGFGRVKRFSWEKCLDESVDFYKLLYAKKFGKMRRRNSENWTASNRTN